MLLSPPSQVMSRKCLKFRSRSCEPIPRAAAWLADNCPPPHTHTHTHTHTLFSCACSCHCNPFQYGSFVFQSHPCRAAGLVLPVSWCPMCCCMFPWIFLAAFPPFTSSSSPCLGGIPSAPCHRGETVLPKVKGKKCMCDADIRSDTRHVAAGMA